MEKGGGIAATHPISEVNATIESVTRTMEKSVCVCTWTSAVGFVGLLVSGGAYDRMSLHPISFINGLEEPARERSHAQNARKN